MSYDRYLSGRTIKQMVSIPLEQGNVLRLYVGWTERSSKSQSLWNRAMSYDFNDTKNQNNDAESQSLWNRAMSYDSSGVIKPCGTRLARATSQLFPRLR